MAALGMATQRRVNQFNMRSLADAAWAFVAVDQLNDNLLGSMAGAAEKLVRESNTQSPSSTTEPKLFAWLSKAVQWRVSKLKPQELVNKWTHSTRRLSPLRTRPLRRSKVR
eukprot:gnl/TRDRNA2_/TRDRNA2_94935_c0_seq1.p2 gnl/TRDRNA2_/TRDRNA2_94935_c0~~gnl/TRDRNA2_/TRDRNA2_94935_c0_seq1.p2  ORF type:complete len:111 (+),score=13.34 gnl/TRDRNA2_/TRDRNA2_94935_c0_seq1:524-856(+)